jgi:hypothetical protein
MLRSSSRYKVALVLATALMSMATFSVETASAQREGERGRADCVRDNRDDRDEGDDRGNGGNGEEGGIRGSLRVVGLTADQRLICFRENNPAAASTIGKVTGLAGDASLVGVDFRPANNTLYGVGNAGGVYTIDPNNATATKVAQLTVALNGASFGVDVNPAADALRIISDSGQNLRFSFAAGTTTADGTLTYPPSTAAVTGVTGAAYTNNDLDPNTATTLYDLDSMMDQVAIQSPANSGQLVATGKLGVDTNPQVGFDIYSAVRDGTTVDVRALAALTVGGESRLYRITLFTGRAEQRGSFSSQDKVIGIAIPLNQS